MYFFLTIYPIESNISSLTLPTGLCLLPYTLSFPELCLLPDTFCRQMSSLSWHFILSGARSPPWHAYCITYSWHFILSRSMSPPWHFHRLCLLTDTLYRPTECHLPDTLSLPDTSFSSQTFFPDILSYPGLGRCTECLFPDTSFYQELVLLLDTSYRPMSSSWHFVLFNARSPPWPFYRPTACLLPGTLSYPEIRLLPDTSNRPMSSYWHFILSRDPSPPWHFYRPKSPPWHSYMLNSPSWHFLQA